MDRSAILLKIKEIIADLAEIDLADISDTATFTEDLDLDSLTQLEIGSDVNYAFRLDLSEERLQGVRSVPDALKLIEERRRELDAQGEVA